MRCPVCNEKIEDHHIDSDERGVLEERAKCDKGHYHYKFAYGFESEAIGDVEVLSSWKDKPYESKLKDGIINLAIRIEKNKMAEESQ